jgi:hypothetical protein
VSAGHVEEGNNPRPCLAAVEVGEVDTALGVTVEPAVRLVERIHDEAARVDGADDLL